MSTTINQTMRTQRGAVLVVSLIILMLMTLIGVTAMQVSTTQEKMVANLREQNVAFQAAEAALRSGEQMSPGGAYPKTGCLKGLCTPAVVTGDPIWKTVDWKDSTKVQVGSSLLPTGSVAEQPRFIIEDVSAIPTSGSSGGTGWDSKDTNKTRLYRITAQGYGLAMNDSGQPLARVMLQSIYSP